jgi:hypothetical protein
MTEGVYRGSILYGFTLIRIVPTFVCMGRTTKQQEQTRGQKQRSWRMC